MNGVCVREKMKVKGEKGAQKGLEYIFAHINICIFQSN